MKWQCRNCLDEFETIIGQPGVVMCACGDSGADEEKGIGKAERK